MDIFCIIMHQFYQRPLKLVQVSCIMHYEKNRKKTLQNIYRIILFMLSNTEKLHRNIRDDLNDMQVVKKVKETVLT